MVGACLSLLAGIYLLQLSSFRDSVDLILVAFAAFTLACVNRGPVFLLIAVLGVAAFAAASGKAVSERLTRSLAGDSVMARVRVADFPQFRDGNTILELDARATPRLPGRLRVSWYEPPVLPALGDEWLLELRLRRPRGLANPGGFDRETWLTQAGVGATGYVVPGPRNRLLSSGQLTGLETLRQRFVSRVNALQLEANAASILIAIVVGARQQMRQEDWERFSATGTSHLMAISGLHIGLAAAGCYWLAAALVGIGPARCNAHRIAVLVSLLGATAYAGLTGFGVPAQRALVMLGLAALALRWRRAIAASDVLALACCCVALFAPLTTLSPGFKLSFAAVALLLWQAGERAGSNAASRWRQIGMALLRFGRLQLLLLLGLLPFTVLLFDRLALLAPLVNFVAIPVFSLVTLPLALIGLLLDGQLQPAGDAALRGAGATLKGLLRLIGFAQALPGTPDLLRGFSLRAWPVLALPALIALMPSGWPGRLTAVVAVTWILRSVAPAPATDCVQATVLDVGQGLAVAVRSANATTLYDTGVAFRTGGSSAGSVILPFLRQMSIDALDRLIISHADIDHAGGMDEVLAAVPVGAVLVGEPLPGRVDTACLQGQQWQDEAVRFRMLGPPPGHAWSGNDASCVLEVSVGERRLLLTGDIETSAERRLIEQGVLQPVDVVVVPHHGSATSSSRPLVERLRPQHAIVSAAHASRWGLPKPEVSGRWEQAGATVVSTGTTGAVAIRMCASQAGTELRYFREERRRIWHDP